MKKNGKKTKKQLIAELVELRQEITEMKKLENLRKQVEDKLNFERAQLLSIFDSINEIIYISDPTTYEILYVNKATKKNFRKDLVGGICYREFQGLEAPCEFCTNKIILIDKYKPYQWEYHNPKINKSLAITDIIIKWPDGRDVRFEFAIDITERNQMEDELRKHRDYLEEMVDKRTAQLQTSLAQLQQETAERKLVEESLLESENKFRSIFLQSPIGIELYDSNGRLIDANKACLDIFGVKIGFELFEDPNVPDEAKYKLLNGEVVKYEFEFNFDIIKKRLLYDSVNSGIKHIDVVISPLVSERSVHIGYLVQVQDITKRKRAEEAIETERQKLYSLMDGLPAVVHLQAPDYSIPFSNRYFWDRFGKPKKRACYEILHHRDKPCEDCHIFRIFDTKTPSTREYTCSDGGTYQIWNYPFSDIDGSPLVLVVGFEITERKRMEESLRLSEERFSKAFHNNPNPMAIVRFKDDSHIDANKSFIDSFGFSREEFIGRTVIDIGLFVNIEDFKYYKQLLLEQGYVHNLNVPFITKSNDVRSILLSGEVIELNNEKCRLIAINDITELKRMEIEMARLDRLNLVGEMAAGIGHEIRNPMTTVRGFLQMLGSKEECVKYKDYYKLMIEELDRANSIITEFLSLAKNKMLEKKSKNMNSILEAMQPLIQSDVIKNENNLILELGEIPYLQLDKKEIRQLILNLVRNGLDAMLPGGTLTIRTFTENKEIVLSVQDEGKGIEPDVLEKIGTPFFTTKENGTGLGMAVCYSIAARHNAKIEIESCTTGTTFFIRFKQE